MNARIQRIVTQALVIAIVLVVVLLASVATQLRRSGFPAPRQDLPGWKTNTAKSLINLEELIPGGPEKDGIPALTGPSFETTDQSQTWLNPNAPVIAVVINKTARAYPLAIMVWHEIVNDTVDGMAIAVTYSPLCNSAIVYDRTIKKRTHTFGVTGMLRNSDMVMYDTQTETLFQQFTGQGLVGDLAGHTLDRIPSQVISLAQFARSYEEGRVLSPDTGYEREYGSNPYVGYDDISNVPFMFSGLVNGALSPMERVVAISFADVTRAYPFYLTRSNGVINDHAGNVPIVIFHAGSTLSAIDSRLIRNSRQVGSTGVFRRVVDKRELTFRFDGLHFIDQQTRTTWDVTGKALRGPLRGKRLTPIAHGDYFAFAWLTFYPNTEICR